MSRKVRIIAILCIVSPHTFEFLANPSSEGESKANDDVDAGNNGDDMNTDEG